MMEEIKSYSKILASILVGVMYNYVIYGDHIEN